MLVRRLGLAMAVGALAAASLVSSTATAAGAATTQVAARSSAPAAPSYALRHHKQKKLRLSYAITPEGGTAWRYVFTVTTKRGVPVSGVKFQKQYHATKGKWSNEGTSYVSDANGQFTLIACNISMGVERMYSKATKRHKAVKVKFLLRPCG